MVRVASAGIDGVWQEHPGERFSYVTTDGARLVWSAKAAVVALEGAETPCQALAPRLAEALAEL